MADGRRFGSHWRGRAAFLILVVGLAWILDGFMRHRVIDHAVVLRYGRRRAGLISSKLTYRSGGEVVGEVDFSYRTQRALREQRHTTRLVPGVYEVEVALRYGPPAQRLVRLRRVLVVKAGAPSRIALD
ncbi:MAG: hypothetical protein IPL40_15980 [Proteobacteria bacterium]|nr:hypothetical protein [Pseudomonadota bacterium]